MKITDRIYGMMEKINRSPILKIGTKEYLVINTNEFDKFGDTLYYLDICVKCKTCFINKGIDDGIKLCNKCIKA